MKRKNRRNEIYKDDYLLMIDNKYYMSNDCKYLLDINDPSTKKFFDITAKLDEELKKFIWRSYSNEYKMSSDDVLCNFITDYNEKEVYDIEINKVYLPTENIFTPKKMFFQATAIFFTYDGYFYMLVNRKNPTIIKLNKITDNLPYNTAIFDEYFNEDQCFYFKVFKSNSSSNLRETQLSILSDVIKIIEENLIKNKFDVKKLENVFYISDLFNRDENSWYSLHYGKNPCEVYSKNLAGKKLDDILNIGTDYFCYFYVFNKYNEKEVIDTFINNLKDVDVTKKGFMDVINNVDAVISRTLRPDQIFILNTTKYYNYMEYLYKALFSLTTNYEKEQCPSFMYERIKYLFKDSIIGKDIKKKLFVVYKYFRRYTNFSQILNKFIRNYYKNPNTRESHEGKILIEFFVRTVLKPKLKRGQNLNKKYGITANNITTISLDVF